MRLVLFDCDGTLADSFGLIVETMMRCFASAGLPAPTQEAVRGIIGVSLDLAIHRLAPTLRAEELPVVVDIYRREFHAARAEAAYAERLFDGAEALLRSLALRDDVVLGMVTGKSRRGVRLVVEAHGLDGLFHVARTADDCPSKPHPAMVLECCAQTGISPAATVVVGDALYDMQMAKSAGAHAIGVTWGALDAGGLSLAGADRVAETMGGLAMLLDAWLEEPQPEIIVAVPG